MNSKYSKIWYALVDIKAIEGLHFNDLISSEDSEDETVYIGAWANILIKAKTIQQAIEIVPLGFEELGFEVIKFDKIENFETLVNESTVEKEVIYEADWLLDSEYIFKISDKLFPYFNG